MSLPPDLSISAVTEQMPGAFLLLSFLRAALTSPGVIESVQQALLVVAAVRMVGSAGVLLFCRRRLKCSFQRSRQLASVVMRLPLESFTWVVLIRGPLQARRSRLKTRLMLFSPAADSRWSASVGQNFSLSSAMAAFRWWLRRRYSARSPRRRASRLRSMMSRVLCDIQGLLGEDRGRFRTSFADWRMLSLKVSQSLNVLYVILKHLSHVKLQQPCYRH